ncbi:MAG: hypothetical protein U1E70_27960, partial [Acetobacteraceae bacterium]
MKHFIVGSGAAGNTGANGTTGAKPMANHYKLSGHGIELEYTTGGRAGVPALTLKDNGVVRSYLPSEVTTDQTDLGTMVSVPLTTSADKGGARFGFFLPTVGAASGRRTPVTTSGVIQTYSGPGSVPHWPSTWS